MVCLLVVSFSIVQAQHSEYFFRQGKFIVGERINYVRGGRVYLPDQKSKDIGHIFKIAPSFGYYINNLVSVGMSMGYEHMKNDFGRQNTFTLIPYLRYYFPVGQNFLFLHGETGMGIGWNKTNGEKSRHLTWDTGLKPGFFINLSEKTAVEVTFSRLEYQQVWIKDIKSGDMRSVSDWKYQVLDISFGFSYLF